MFLGRSRRRRANGPLPGVVPSGPNTHYGYQLGRTDASGLPLQIPSNALLRKQELAQAVVDADFESRVFYSNAPTVPEDADGYVDQSLVGRTSGYAKFLQRCFRLGGSVYTHDVQHFEDPETGRVEYSVLVNACIKSGRLPPEVERRVAQLP